ncbi:DUF6600 domain-containing protein [Alsobacter sp. R-9]
MMNKINGLAGVAALALLAGLAGPPAFAQSRDMHRQDRSRPDDMRSSDSRRRMHGDEAGRFGQGQRVTTQMLYDEVARTGEFVQIKGLGRAWKPDDVDDDWKPYTRGRWIFNQQVGWYFESHEPWAEVTYHYGRWYDDPDEGWVWIADTEWAPAWVEWRYSRQHVGWRPLPPRQAPRVARRSGRETVVREEWVFVPTERITTERISTVIVEEPQQITTIYRETRPMGRVERRGSYAVNFGLDPDVVRRESRVTIESRNLPRVEAAPVPQAVQAISTEQRTTTSTTTEGARPPDQQRDATRPSGATDTDRTTTGSTQQTPDAQQRLRRDQQKDATRPAGDDATSSGITGSTTETRGSGTTRQSEDQQRLRSEQRRDAPRPGTPDARSTDRTRPGETGPSGAARTMDGKDGDAATTGATRQQGVTQGSADKADDDAKKRMRNATGKEGNAATAPDPRRRGEPYPTGAAQRQPNPGAPAQDTRRNDDAMTPSARSGAQDDQRRRQGVSGPSDRPAAARSSSGDETTGSVARPGAKAMPQAPNPGKGDAGAATGGKGPGEGRKLPKPGDASD